jgi:hypothetical protein
MATRTCPDCGTSLEGARTSRLRCEPCAWRKKVVASTAWHKAHPKKRTCRSCGADISGTGLRVRCAACSPKRACLDRGADISGEHDVRVRRPACAKRRRAVLKVDADRRRQLRPKRPTLECELVSEGPWDEADWQDEPPKPPPARPCPDCGRDLILLPDYVVRCAPCERKRYFEDRCIVRRAS